MATLVCRVQFLDDTDPFNSTNFPEPTRPPHFTFHQDIPLINQIAGVHRLLRAPHKLDDCTLQLSHNGSYLDLESSLAEQRDELEGFQEDTAGTRGKKHSIVLRTQLTVRVHACIEKLYNSTGRDLRRALFSLKQIFQDDKDLVHEFVMAEGLICLIKVGTEADQNYQNYILRALGQIMLYVDGMNGVINHIETIQWLYALIGSKFRLVVKTALKLLLVFVEYSESNAPLLIDAISTVDTKRGFSCWSNAMEILAEKDGVDTELLVYTTTLINKTLSALPDQDSFYDLVDVLEEQGMEALGKRFLGRRGTDLDLMEQLNIYETTLRHEDGDEDFVPSPGFSGRKVSLGGGAKRRGLERRRSRRASLGKCGNASPCNPPLQRSRFQPFNGAEDMSEREEEEEESDSDGREGPLAFETSSRGSSLNQSARVFMNESITSSVCNTLREDRENGEREHGEREHGEGEHGERERGEREHGEREHGERERGEREHGEREHGEREHGEREHGERERGEREHGEREHIKREQEGERTPPQPPLSLPSPLIILTPHPISSLVPPSPLLSPPSSCPTPQPSLAPPSQLAALLASRNSTVTVLPTKGVTMRGTHPSPPRLPYLPQSPFHLFSYDLSDEPSAAATRQEGDSMAAAPRNGIQWTTTPTDKPALGGLLSSSYRQHQESLTAEREKRRAEREERLQRIEREERNKHNRDYVDKMEEVRMLRDERYKHVERLAAEEFERDRVPRSRPDLCPNFDPTEAWPPTTSYSPTPSSSVASQDEEPDGEQGEPDTEPEDETAFLHCGTEDLKPQDFTSCSEPEETEVEPSLEDREEQKEPEEPKQEAEEEKVGTSEEGEEEEEEEEVETLPVKREEEEQEDSGILSDKERQNEEVNEKDNCSASSISSASSTLEREERWITDNGRRSQSVQDVSINDPCSDLLHNKLFMLDMLYSQSPKPSEEEDGEEGGKEEEVKQETTRPLAEGEEEENAQKTDSLQKQPKKIASNLNVRAFAERFGDLVKGLGSPPTPLDCPPDEADIDKAPPPPPKKESETIWDQLLASPRELRIRDIDFTDLKEEDDRDILDVGLMGGGLPPPPPFSSTVLPTPSEAPQFLKKKKTIKLFWNEVRPSDTQYLSNRISGDSLWSKLEPVKIDTSKLEHLFETKSKEIAVAKKTAADGKRQEVIVLDSKRSNSINIGLTVLPPPRTIKTAILNFDEYALNKEGIEKILTMIPTEEEKQKIQEAQLTNPDIPLGSAEQFLLILSSISELSARLQLWAFKMDYEVTEKEVAEPLQDLKEGMEQLEKNKTLRYILSTLLAIGNFLNSTNAKGFELSYLEKVPEVKDTVHKQSLLHHACSIVVDIYPQSTDLYSEIGAITRSAKVDFDQLQDNLSLMERRCKASWDHLKVIGKHEMKPTLKQKMSDFLKDCAERIIILKIVHRRIINRFHAFLLFLGHPAYSIREISVHRFSKIISEFALEYRTTRDRVLQQKQKRADHRERNKTRGKMIMDVNAPSAERCNAGSSNSSAPSGVVECVQPQGLGHAEDAAEHEFMKAVLKTGLQGGDREASGVPGLRTRSRPGRGGRVQQVWTPRVGVGPESQRSGDDEADEIMERIVRSATQGANQRAEPRERRRSRVNRKSLRRTLKTGLTPEEALLLGLSDGSEMPV
ncbi:hypothetical protein DPEC_G00289320 [Dallia pectoralis]|uniref:Uncharacterized protein n=1 Tax=Dallia pectoralis TaxID=75939 RepID=A0ACC2FL14_DALPE|nr:hypothetical protein DPEC_G00289320 [Dallia pectoralis]